MPLYTFECSVCGVEEILFDRMDPVAARKEFKHTDNQFQRGYVHKVTQVFHKPAGAVFKNNGIHSRGTGRKSTWRTPDMDRRESRKLDPTDPKRF